MNAPVTIKGGEKADAYIRDLMRKISKPGRLRVGFLNGATYPDGTSVALVAATQNFGAPSRGIPPRPFFSNMVKDKQAEWGPAAGRLLVANNYDAEKTLNQVGAAIEGQLKQAIVDTNSPPLQPRTIARKGSSKPLVDTGHMLNSTGFEVETK